MGLFEKIFPRKTQIVNADQTFKLLTAYAPVFTSWRGKIYESDLVRAAVNAHALHVSKMQVQLHGSAQPKLRTKLRIRPNEMQTWSQFLRRLDTILMVNNTAYIVPVLDEYDETTGIYAILPERVEAVQSNGVPYLRFRFASGQTAAMELRRVGILTNYQYSSDLFGESNAALNETMQLIEMQKQGISEGVKSSASYRFMTTLTNFVSPEDLVKERERFTRDNLSGSAGGILIFPSNYKDTKQVESKPWVVDADQMKLIQTNVENYFGLNDAIIRGTADADQLDAFYNSKLEPLAIQLAEVLTNMLFTPLEQANGSRIAVTSDRLQYMSTATKLKLITTLGDRGMLRVNEARRLLNYDDVPGGDKLMPIRGEYYNATEGGGGDAD